ncbi:ABC transporter ATP-binding protein [Lutispora saccharofermentans]|uniref:ABC transporter ATP-binding protein n=1 Tax=Lutispora saccharofermentans TaxID=3024236 RepID=A0ABT1NG26_9FIRM|nr:ABC transporter ATP-binding protein [Lutispora saccharofermentans]MCQ1530019.1 ABC transporter ATP-binding protein [Lutispora saccharofermentans]
MTKLLEFKDYSMGFKDDNGDVYNLLDKVTFCIEEGKALGVVGESGCGKSMTSLSIMRLLPSNIVFQGGQIIYKGEDLLKKPEADMQRVRGKDISMVFQEPMTSLNPVLTVGFQIGEVLRKHYPDMNKEQIREKVIEQLELVGIPSPEKRLNQYPHEFSGGMRQRVMIAMAVVCWPNLLIADEPTTALDVTIQAQVLDLMQKLKEKGSLMLITHNLGIVSEICDEVVVMYAGRVVEKGSAEEIFENPCHPYTKGLMAAIPSLSVEQEELYSIPGTVPVAKNFAAGCRFADRCGECAEGCKDSVPPTKEVSPNHYVQCWLGFEGR